MGQVEGQDQRDILIYRRWVDGARQDDLAAQYQVQQPAVSKASEGAGGCPGPGQGPEVRRAVDLSTT